MADLALKHFGLEPGRDVAVVPLRGNRVAALETGAVDAALLGVPENIIAVDKGRPNCRLRFSRKSPPRPQRAAVIRGVVSGLVSYHQPFGPLIKILNAQGQPPGFASDFC
jgi:hypothetical protein